MKLMASSDSGSTWTGPAVDTLGYYYRLWGGENRLTETMAITENLTVIMSVLAVLEIIISDTTAITEDIYGQESGLIGSVIC